MVGIEIMAYGAYFVAYFFLGDKGVYCQKVCVFSGKTLHFMFLFNIFADMERCIVVFSMTHGAADVYKDLSDAASHVDCSPRTLRRKMEDGVCFVSNCWVCYGNIHKSNRGRK